MKIGVSTATLFPEKHTEEAAAVLQSLGIELAEVFFSTFYEYRPEFSKELGATLGALKINSVHAMPLNFECNLFDTTRRVRGDGFYWLDQIARSARLLGCENYTFHGFPRLGSKRDDIGFVAERVAEAHSFMAGYGVNLCIENTSYYAYNRPTFLRELRGRCPDLYGVLDLKQARRSGYPYPMYIEDMRGAIAYVHVSDIDADGKMCLPCRGVFDFKDLFVRLKDAGFDGNVIIENYRRDYGGISEIKESVDALSEIAYKLG